MFGFTAVSIGKTKLSNNWEDKKLYPYTEKLEYFSIVHLIQLKEKDPYPLM